jgi:hypothetical protein
VKHLRALAGSVSGDIDPLPDARSRSRTTVSSRRINELYEAVTAIQWHVEEADQYELVVDLARQMTLARHARSLGSGNSQPKRGVVNRIAAVADQKFAGLKQVRWTTSLLASLNGFAPDQLNSIGEGIVVYCTVLGRLRDQNALLARIAGTEYLVTLKVPPDVAGVPGGSRALVLGLVLPQAVNVRNQTRTVNQRSRLLLTYYMLLVRQDSERQ